MGARVRLASARFFVLLPSVALDDLRTLTPADFALVRRRAAMVAAAEPRDTVRLLAAECETGVGGRLQVDLPGSALVGVAEVCADAVTAIETSARECAVRGETGRGVL